MVKADWPKIRAEYIEDGNITYNELAAKYGLTKTTLYKRARAERWVEARKKYQKKVMRKSVEKMAAKKSTVVAKELLKLQSAADKMANVLDSVMQNTEQFYLHMNTRGEGAGVFYTECTKEEKADTKAIKDLASALKDMTFVLRNIYDIPTIQEREAMKIAAARLEMEKAKADTGPEEDAGTGVVVLAEVMEEDDGEDE